jgi:hypothetical protein
MNLLGDVKRIEVVSWVFKAKVEQGRKYLIGK